MSVKILVGIACHNRIAMTLACIEALSQMNSTNVRLSISLLDDGSTDGTSESVTKKFPQVEVLRGNGTYFWAKSMHILHKRIDLDGFDGFLMLNDDVLLSHDSINNLEKGILINPRSIIVGSTCDKNGVISYSGLVCAKKENYFKLIQKNPSKGYLNLDSFVGNFTYIPKGISNVIGFLNGDYSHHYADVEYGIRAKKYGFEIKLMPEIIGFCEANPVRVAYVDSTIPLRQRIEILNSRFCYPFWDHFRFYKSIGGFGWQYYFLQSYLAKWVFVFFPMIYGKLKR